MYEPRLILGDCETELWNIPDNSVDMVIESSPYWNARDYAYWSNYRDYLEFMRRHFVQCYLLLKSAGRIAVNVPDGYGRNPWYPLYADMIQVLRECSFHMRGNIVWYKGAASNSKTSWGSWRASSNPCLIDFHEMIIVADKGEHHIENIGRTISKQDFVRNTRSVWEIAPETNSKHPAPFPLELPWRLIELYTNPGMVVLDPFLGCYDKDTFVMTKRGFVEWKNVSDSDEFLTRSFNGELSYSKSTKLYRYHYTGDMHHYFGRSLDLMVTPNHNMLFREHHSKNTELIRSDAATHRVYHIPNKSSWTLGNSNFTIGKYDPHDFAKFIGLYIAEGTRDSYRLRIKQSKSPEFVDAVRKTVFSLANEETITREYIYGKCHTFEIKNKELLEYCEQFPYQVNRRIPRELLESSKSILKSLWDGLLLGDGTHYVDGNDVYFTTSLGLAYDVVELLIKLGVSATINNRGIRNPSISKDGRIFIGKSNAYEVHVRNANELKVDTYDRKEIIKYDGMVYCAEIPIHHTLLVMRNGKVTWCGNSGTTALAAMRLDRQAIGIERDAAYYKMAVDRIYQEYSPMGLLDIMNGSTE